MASNRTGLRNHRNDRDRGLAAHARTGDHITLVARRGCRCCSSNRRPTHPGAILREDVLPALAMTQT
jgi:hypothetical protein